MQRRTGGGIPSEISKSNKAAGGAVQGTDIGDVLPGVLESLQESAAATVTPRLYYDEVLGQFNYPSYQRTFGIHNKIFQNIQKFNDQGEVWVERDIFWEGPCMINLRVNIPNRWIGNVKSADAFQDTSRYRPQLFYSWGAGYAAVKQFEMNLGGAMTYRLDRYANFMAIMASCYSVSQRFALMKLSGGGVIRHGLGLEALMGLSGSTAEYSTMGSYNYNGEGKPVGSWHPIDQILQPHPYQITYDNWTIAVKTPHTNFNNPRNPRKSIDTNILSEPFNLRIILGNLTEFCDTGTGVPTFTSSKSYPPFTFYTNFSLPWVEHYRQYENIYSKFYPFVLPPPSVGVPLYDYIAKNTTTDDLSRDQPYLSNLNLGNFFPSSSDLESIGNPKPEPLRDTDSITVRAELIVPSLRLTNPLLGAYDVLKGRLDQAVYYPFQHFTSQAYYPTGLPFKDITLLDIINSSFPEANLPYSERTMVRQTINIPVNPMTAMYIMVFREKDRFNELSKKGGYSPALFWEGLLLPKYSITYGSEQLINKQNANERVMEDIYNNCTPLTIPYRGGCTNRVENLSGRGFTSIGAPSAMAQTHPSCGLYTGVDRLSYMYEICLCEKSPIRTEEIFQQTPSFLGEQLNFDFLYEPVLAQNLGGPCNYDTTSNLSFLDFYPPTDEGVVEVAALNSVVACDSSTTFTHDAEQNYYGIPPDAKGYGKIANPWILNNGPLLVQVVYAQNALWQMNPNFSKVVFSRG